MMKKKRRNAFGVILLAGSVILTGCSSNGQNATGSPSASAGAGGEASGSENGGQKIAIELLETGWVNTATDDRDPFKKWIDDTFNVDFKLTNITANDFESKLLTRFSANEPPDLIYSTDRNVILKLYNQGVLLEDWTPLLDKVPTAAGTITDIAKQYVSKDGKMIALPKQADASIWSFKIRKDWLDALGLPVPQTDQELLETLRQFTNGDPDGNKKKDTWGVSTSGEGAHMGTLAALEAMFGQGGFQVADNKADHSILNGTHQRFLDFVKQLHEEKIIDPDWYTQNWGQKAAKLYTDKIGVDQYPGVLLAEYDQNNGNTGKAADMWVNLPMPKGAENGGKSAPGAPIGGMLAISANAAKDPEKLDRILQLIENVTHPNEGFWMLRWGIGITGETLVDLPSGAKFFSEEKEDPNNYRVAMPGAWDYGTWIATNLDNVLQSSADEAGKVEEKMYELDKETMVTPRYSDFESLLTLDPQLMSDVTKLQNEFDIKYVLGSDKDYEAFKTRWLKAGGQQLLDSVTEQYQALGYIK